jgi:hypothetical protein
MNRTNKDIKEKKQRRMLKETDQVDGGDYSEVYKKFGMDLEDLHTAIRKTCSKPGPSDNSRAAYRHEVKETKERMLKKTERNELLDEIETPIEE